MSFYNHPKEHRLLKPKSGFERSKQLMINELYEGYSTKQTKNRYQLNDRALLRSRKKQNWKIIRELIIVFSFTIPVALLMIQFFSKQLGSHKNRFIVAAHHKEMSSTNIDNNYLKPFNQSLKLGYDAFFKKDYQKALYYFNQVEKNYSYYINGMLGTIAVYDEMCKMGNIYACDLLKEKLSTKNVKSFYPGLTNREKVIEVNYWKEKMLKTHLKIPNVRPNFNFSLRSAYQELDKKNYKKAIEIFSTIEVYYDYYINGVMGLLIVYDEMCKNGIPEGCDLFEKELNSEECITYFGNKGRLIKEMEIKNWRKRMYEIHL